MWSHLRSSGEVSEATGGNKLMNYRADERQSKQSSFGIQEIEEGKRTLTFIKPGALWAMTKFNY